jgi:Vault protein inter-alpha-trypsin domain
VDLKAIKDAYYLVCSDTKEPVPLESIHLHSDIVGSMVSYTMTQNYKNVEPDTIETVFFFPIDVTCAVSKIMVKFTLPDGTFKELETIIDERFKVEAKYEDAVAVGKTAVMGGYVARNIRDMMRVNIGNFPGHTTAVLKVLFYQKLEIEDLSYCLRVPMSYIPPYMGDLAGYIT